MTKITEDLIRKRAEHNESIISTLEELSLHQLDIDRIEYIDKWCRNLKILYLQGNLISKIENLGRLKQLTYLNLAVNNISKVENLEGCESLVKLDLTLNFIAQLSSIRSLQANDDLRELYLMGNPCKDYSGYREYVLATLPSLTQLDGEDISRSQVIQACQRYEIVRKEIEEQEEARIEEIARDTRESNNDNFSPHKKEPYSIKSRNRMHEHFQKLRDEKQKPPEKDKIQKPRSLFTKDGTPLNINEAKLGYRLDTESDPSYIHLDVNIYKFLSTSHINVDINPTYVTLTVKGKIFQMRLPCEVLVGKSECKRSQVTGSLSLKLKRAEDVVIVKPVLRNTEKSLKPKDPERGRASERSGDVVVGQKHPINMRVADVEEEGDADDDIPPLV